MLNVKGCDKLLYFFGNYKERKGKANVKTYEALVIIPPQLGGEALDRSKSVFEEAVKKHGGNVVNRTEIGRRSLGYTVKKTKEGFVTAFDFQLAPAQAGELTKTLRLAEDIVKFTLIEKPRIKPRAPRKLSRKAQAIADKKPTEKK